MPPLLLRPGPHFFFTTVNAAKRPIDVVTAMHKVGRTVTVVWRQQGFIHRRPEHGTKLPRLVFVAQLNLGHFVLWL
jgi:hypothetical protein